MGISQEAEIAHGDDVEFPEVQVFYSQYRYVVGYYGVETFLDAQRQDTHEQRFGYPLTVLVSDYSGTDLELTEEGYPATDEFVGWTDAEDAVFVVDSDARATHGETVVPFTKREDAEAFRDEYGGGVVTWTDLLEAQFEIDDAEVVRNRVDDHHERADALVADSRALLDRSERPVSVTVGENGTETIQDAVDQAPTGTTVLVPEGTYEERIEIAEPITLAGDGATIDGGGDGTVVTVTADHVAVTGLELTGTGGIGTGSERDEDEAVDDEEPADDVADWDRRVEDVYGTGDAGVAVTDASRPLIEDVTIHTEANGVLLRDSPDSVVRNATVYGTEDPNEGFMGVVAMRSPGVIEESTFVGGRDGVYTHRADGITIRDNEARDLRFGVHFMYTSDSMVADNRVENPDVSGVTIMTSPERNAIVGNYVEGGNFGFQMLGSHFYIADNVATDNDVGVRDAVSNTIYEGNVFAGSEVGFQSASVLPADRVIDNDFVDNDEHVTADEGPLRVFTHDGAGNYWDGAIGTPVGGTLDRSYTPTDPVDKRLHYVDGTPTLARSPAVTAIGGLEAAVPALRQGTVVDTDPLCEPANPDALEGIGWDGPVRGCGMR
ncbi:NosD domain-containing protein [Natrialbaceae archaeon A-gly3]